MSRDTAIPASVKWLLTPASACELLALSPQALDARRRRGQIPHVHLGRLVRYRAADIYRIAEQGIAVQAPPPRRLARVK